MAKKKLTCASGIGGQAVMEGVMMKNGDLYAVAVRKPDGEIEIDTEEYHGVLHGSPIKKVPFIRGMFNFVDSMILGMRTLTYSANFYEDEEAKEYVIDIVKGINGNLENIIDTISKNLKKDWTISRVSKVNLALLKLAIYEIEYKQIPFKVVINEYIFSAQKRDVLSFFRSK